jgi:hypothetical protein
VSTVFATDRGLERGPVRVCCFECFRCYWYVRRTCANFVAMIWLTTSWSPFIRALTIDGAPIDERFQYFNAGRLNKFLSSWKGRCGVDALLETGFKSLAFWSGEAFISQDMIKARHPKTAVSVQERYLLRMISSLFSRIQLGYADHTRGGASMARR